MSDSDEPNDPLDSLQQMLAAEIEGHRSQEPAPPKPAPKEPTVEELGGLLGDLLSEAQKEVDRGPGGSAPLAQKEQARDEQPGDAAPKDLLLREVSRDHSAPSPTTTFDELARALESPQASKRSSHKPLWIAAAAVVPPVPLGPAAAAGTLVRGRRPGGGLVPRHALLEGRSRVAFAFGPPAPAVDSGEHLPICRGSQR